MRLIDGELDVRRTGRDDCDFVRIDMKVLHRAIQQIEADLDLVATALGTCSGIFKDLRVLVMNKDRTESPSCL